MFPMTLRSNRSSSSSFGVVHSVPWRMELITEFQIEINNRNTSLSGDFNQEVSC